MRHRLSRLAVLAGVILVPSLASAQVAGLPVRNAGVGTGIGIAADVGFPNGDYGKGTAFGGTGFIGLGPLGVTASVSRWNPAGDGDALTSVGGTLNLKVLGGPLIPLSLTLQGGIGRTKTSDIEGGSITTTHFPIGLGIGVTIPNPAFSIKPWAAPRIDVVHESGEGLISGTRAKFGISGGIDVGFLSGISIRAMYDRVSAGGGATPAVFSLGAGFKVGT
jgi:hypothetical protein